jgi:acetyltransferase
VRLDVRDAGEVRAAWREIESAVLARAGPNHFLGVTVEPMVRGDGLEAILGSTCDPQCGPVILFGTGGSHVALHQDRALGLPPLDRNLARRMIDQTRLGAALRDEPVGQRDALEELLVRFAGLVVAHPVIKEIDLNPVFISSDRIVVLDARIILHAAGVVHLPSAIALPGSDVDQSEVQP